jgi:hypothetical protein
MDSKGATFVIILILVLAAAFYWQQENQPVSQTPKVFSIPLGSWGHCENHDGSKTWKPRADGKCYAIDAPSPIGDVLRQTFNDRTDTVNRVPPVEVQPPPPPQAIPPRICIATSEIPGVDPRNVVNVREWTTRSDGLCYPADAPASITTSVFGDNFRGGLFGCKIPNTLKTWLPRSDGLCYAEDAPK